MNVPVHNANDSLRCENPGEYLTDVELLCVTCQRPIKARINTQQWIRCEWISPSGECQACALAKREKELRG